MKHVMAPTIYNRLAASRLYFGYIIGIEEWDLLVYGDASVGSEDVRERNNEYDERFIRACEQGRA
jgi:hypothetical protein